MKFAFSVAAKPKITLICEPATDKLMAEYLKKRGFIEGRTQFALYKPNTDRHEDAYFITHKKRPIAYFKVRNETIGQSEALRLLVAESKPHSIIKGSVLAAILDCVERIVKDNDCSMIILDSPNYKAPHMRLIFEEKGYAIPQDRFSYPRKFL